MRPCTPPRLLALSGNYWLIKPDQGLHEGSTIADSPLNAQAQHSPFSTVGIKRSTDGR